MMTSTAQVLALSMTLTRVPVEQEDARPPKPTRVDVDVDDWLPTSSPVMGGAKIESDVSLLLDALRGAAEHHVPAEMAVDAFLGTVRGAALFPMHATVAQALRSVLGWPEAFQDCLRTLVWPTQDLREYAAELPSARALFGSAPLLRMIEHRRIPAPRRIVCAGDGGVGVFWRRGSIYADLLFYNSGSAWLTIRGLGQRRIEEIASLDAAMSQLNDALAPQEA